MVFKLKKLPSGVRHLLSSQIQISCAAEDCYAQVQQVIIAAHQAELLTLQSLLSQCFLLNKECLLDIHVRHTLTFEVGKTNPGFGYVCLHVSSGWMMPFT